MKAMRLNINNSRSLRRPSSAFTLIEMLIVAALIALFSGIAVISIQTQLENNRRKAIIGESRQIATAMDFAYNDIGFFPNIAYLQQSQTTLQLTSESIFGDSLALFRGFDQYLVGVVPDSKAESTLSNWTGPYIAPAQSRSSASGGLGTTRRMQIFASDPIGVEYPVDALGNPWMLYSMHIDRTNVASPFLYFTTMQPDDSTVANTTNPSATGNYMNAIVSYGRNRVPGGGLNFQPSGNIDTPGTNEIYGLRLYNGNPNQGDNPLTLLDGNDLRGNDGALRASAWSEEFFINAGGSAAVLATDDNGNTIGITDTGSDDVVFTF